MKKKYYQKWDLPKKESHVMTFNVSDHCATLIIYFNNFCRTCQDKIDFIMSSSFLESLEKNSIEYTNFNNVKLVQ